MLPLLTLAATKPVQRLQSLLGFAVCGSLAKANGEALGPKMKKEQLTLLKDRLQNSLKKRLSNIWKAASPSTGPGLFLIALLRTSFS